MIGRVHLDTTEGGGTRHASGRILLVEAAQVTRGASGTATGVRVSGTLTAADPRAVGWSTPDSPRRSGAASSLGSSSTGRTGTPNTPQLLRCCGSLHDATRDGGVPLVDDVLHRGDPQWVSGDAGCGRACVLCCPARDGSRAGRHHVGLRLVAALASCTGRSAHPNWVMTGGSWRSPSPTRDTRA